MKNKIYVHWIITTIIFVIGIFLIGWFPTKLVVAGEQLIPTFGGVRIGLIVFVSITAIFTISTFSGSNIIIVLSIVMVYIQMFFAYVALIPLIVIILTIVSVL